MDGSLLSAIDDAILAAKKLKEKDAVAFIKNSYQMIASTFKAGNKLLIAGNGGSLCDAMHFAEELTGQFRKKRKALPAIALSDPGHMSCVSNDMGFDEIFARGVEALGNPGDIFIALTTSGNSNNLVRAIDTAKEKKLKTIAFLGKDGGMIKNICDLQWIVDGFTTSDRIQEAHMAAIHIIIEQVENVLFYDKNLIKKLQDASFVCS